MEAKDISTQHGKFTSVPSPPLLVWLLLFSMLLFTAVIAHRVNLDVRESAQAAFRRNAEKTHEAVAQRMYAYEQVLRGGVGLFNASDRVNRNDWKSYVASLRIEENFPGIQGIGFSKYIQPAELNRHIRQIRAEGFAHYSVTPAGQRPEYTSIIYLEPFNARNQRAFGFDMFSEPTRHAAMVQARDSGKAAISGKVVLKQETSQGVQPGFLMYLPLYRKGADVTTPEERAKALLGYVYSPFRMNDLMSGILGSEFSSPEIDLEIYDGESISKENLLYDDDGIMHGKNEHKHRLFHVENPIIVSDHVWTLAISSTPAFEGKIEQSEPVIVALTGTLISFLFFLVAWSLATNRSRAQQIALQMTSELRKQEALTHAIMNEAADGIITINELGEVQSFNATATQIFGYKSDEVLGKNINILMPEPYHSEHDAYLHNYLTTGQQKIIGIGREVQGKRKNGEVFAMDLAVSEVNQGDNTRLFAGIVRDISDRKRAEENLRRSEERFDLAIRGANDGLWDWNISENTSYHSPRWNAMLGYPEIETNGPSGEWLQLMHPDDVERAKMEVTAYLNGQKEHYQTEFRMRHKDGHYVWILSRGFAQRDAQGKACRMVGIYSDISKQKQMEKMKSEFVSTVSHELRTPLTSIRGSLGLVAGGVAGELPAQASELVTVAYKNTERLLSLINDILDIEKIQSGKLSFTLTPQALMPLIEQTIAANAGYAKQYHVHYHLVASLPDVMVNVDEGRLAQVISNLLSNAAKFSHADGNIEISVTLENQHVRVAVTDHGAGIPEDFRQRIFGKFNQADSSDSRHKGGTGLGLNISKSIIEMMHGEIGFSTEAGAGTTFYFTLPVWRASQPI